jgi:hypothetical protein
MACSRIGYGQWCDGTAMDEDRSARGGLSIAWTCCDPAGDRDGGKKIQNTTTTTELLMRMRSPAPARSLIWTARRSRHVLGLATRWQRS